MKNPSELSPPDPEHDGLTDEEREAKMFAGDNPATEEERQQKVIERVKQDAFAATSEIANRLRKLVDESGMPIDKKKPFLELVSELYDYNRNPASL